MAKPGLSPNMQSGLSELWARITLLCCMAIVDPPDRHAYPGTRHQPRPVWKPICLTRTQGTILGYGQYVLRRRIGANEYPGAGHHAVHFCLDHHAANGGRSALIHSQHRRKRAKRVGAKSPSTRATLTVALALSSGHRHVSGYGWLKA